MMRRGVAATAALIGSMLLAGLPAGARYANLSVSSPDIVAGGVFPRSSAAAACGGQNQPPTIRWSAGPPGTQSYAVALHDADAPAPGGFWHWVVFDIPATARAVGPSGGGASGLSDAGTPGYFGPCPPAGDRPHRYTFMVFALNVARLAGAGERTTGSSLPLLLRGHILARGELEARFGR